MPTINLAASAAHLLALKTTHFVLWSPTPPAAAPRLIIGILRPGNPPALEAERNFDLQPLAGLEGVWHIAAADCGLAEGQVYHYFFEVSDTNPDRTPGRRIRCTDPAALTVDWRIVGPPLPPPYSPDDRQPSAVVKYSGGRLVACDPGDEEAFAGADEGLDLLEPNNRLVIYELPTAWTRTRGGGEMERGIGTFRDVLALVDRQASGANFDDLEITRQGRSYLTDLGVNAIELLPPADSLYYREWGYGTSHFFAPDYELGFPEGHSWPTANQDLHALVRACHGRGIRVLVDAVTAFARNEPSQYVDFDHFCIGNPAGQQGDPDAWTSTRGGGGQALRDGFGSTLFRYARFVNTYDPITGTSQTLSPARQHMLAALTHWVLTFHVDGVRMDSVENVANWDFIGAVTAAGRALMNRRWADAGHEGHADDRFLTVGEELSMPLDLLRQNRLDGLWNDWFRQLVRAAVLGESAEGLGEPSFEWTVRKAIDCRLLGFEDTAQAVNYLTSHDVEGYRRERLFTMLARAGVPDVEKRIKLAFACLLTAVGIPMILAGEEFADEHDLFDRHGNVSQHGGKQVDPVNYGRLSDRSDPLHAMRMRIFDYVARLVRLRTRHPGLGVNDTSFIHADFTPGRRVIAWQRGAPGQTPVVVIANFSDWGSDVDDPRAEYVVANWPPSQGRHWHEVTQDRFIPSEWAGREPLYPWEAKVYELV